MRVFTTASLAGSLFLLAGCDMMVAPWHVSDLEEISDRPVTCMVGKDCDLKWERVLKWVKKTTPLPIATESKNLIVTGPSIKLSPDPAITVKKTKSSAPDMYDITLTADCDDYFGCVPSLLKLKADFVTYVMTGASAPAP